MAQHGYLREYDEGWGRNDDRERDRNSRDDDRERAWRGTGSDPDGGEQRWSDDRRTSGQRSEFTGGGREDDWNQQSQGSSPRYGSQGYGGSRRDFSRSGNSQGGFGGSSDRDRGNFSSRQDDHYRSWRDRQMSALDRDYEDYCREREQQFHQDFDSWRRNRQNQRGSNVPRNATQGTANQQVDRGREGAQNSSEEVMELNNPSDLSTEPHSGPSPTADATLGTNNSENSIIGRSRG